MKMKIRKRVLGYLSVFLLASGMVLLLTQCGAKESGKSAEMETEIVDGISIPTDSASSEALLKERIAISRAQFPTRIDEYTIQIDVDILPGSMTHFFDVNEELLGVDLDNPQVSADALYEGIIETLKSYRDDEAFRSEMLAVIFTGRNLVYDYTGSRSGKKLEVTISNATLKSIFE